MNRPARVLKAGTRAWWHLRWGMRRCSARRRPLPDFLILGTQRGGTTSLYFHLTKHPQVRRALKKESHYFDYRSHWNPARYRAFFAAPGDREPRTVTGEATPYYLYHPRVPKLVARTVPDARLIALVRNPVDRAFSHYKLSVRRGLEWLTFEEALEAESERLLGERERLLADDRYHSVSHQAHSYKDRGLYAEQLERWFAEFGRDGILVLKSETLFGSTVESVRAMEEFLDLQHAELGPLINKNPGPAERMDPRTRAELEVFFRPHNERLCGLLGWREAW